MGFKTCHVCVIARRMACIQGGLGEQEVKNTQASTHKWRKQVETSDCWNGYIQSQEQEMHAGVSWMNELQAGNNSSTPPDIITALRCPSCTYMTNRTMDRRGSAHQNNKTCHVCSCQMVATVCWNQYTDMHVEESDEGNRQESCKQVCADEMQVSNKYQARECC